MRRLKPRNQSPSAASSPGSKGNLGRAPKKAPTFVPIPRAGLLKRKAAVLEEDDEQPLPETVARRTRNSTNATRTVVSYKDESLDDESSEESSDDEYKEKKADTRWSFNAAARKRIIMDTAAVNQNGLYVCPVKTCNMPLATENGVEIKTYYISKKSGKRHNIVAAQMDHFPPWSARLKKHPKHLTEAQIRKDHDDETKLRALCLRCNASHAFEKMTVSNSDIRDGYTSDDESRDEEIWKPLRARAKKKRKTTR
jgi:hypothetical protein